MKQLRVGIAGYGVVGRRRRDYIDAHPNLKTVAVCDRSFLNEEATEVGLNFYAHYRDLLDKEPLNALFVCMTNDIAAEVVIAALEKGLHVFCEKPPGRDVSDIARVIECEKRKPKLKLMYGFNHRYHYSVQDALTMVHSGEMGKVINMRGLYGKSKLVTFNQPDWRTKREISGGGVLLDQGIHMVDLMRLFAGEFNEVRSFISNSHWGYDVEDNAYALMKSKSGIIAMLHSSATHWRHSFELHIGLEKGDVVLGGILSGSKSYGAETLKLVWASEDDLGDPREQTTRYNKDPSWEQEVKNFAEAVLEDRPVMGASSAEAYKTMQLVYKIYCADPVWKDKWSLLENTSAETGNE